MKFFITDKETKEFLLAEWAGGYLQAWEEWSQFLKFKEYNWLTFAILWVLFLSQEVCGRELVRL